MNDPRPPGPRRFEVEDTLESIFDFFDSCYEKGWTDGLPLPDR